jgi:hypothetical protein
MQKRVKLEKWKVKVESTYVFGREERVQTAYEIVIPIKEIAIKTGEHGNENSNERSEDRALCKGFERQAGSRENN